MAAASTILCNMFKVLYPVTGMVVLWGKETTL